MTTPDNLGIVLARMDIKLDHLLADSGDHEVRLRKLEERPIGEPDHERRLRKLEERRWPLPVLATVVSGVSLASSVAGIWLAQ